MKSIFDADAYNEISERLGSLSPESQAVWGQMNVTQMIKHCQKPIEFTLGKTTLKKPNFLMGLLLKRVSSKLYNDEPWKKGLPTAKEYTIVETDTFESEKETLKSLINEFYQRKDSDAKFPVHPYFGKFTKDQYGQMTYKHLDHHFTQFGV
ncbi:hypothetical protein NBRC110019_23520 [Neptunitalea chrysea]|uniref:DUF1569 domain-containing protein n=1 Tax=Neptunitalea chrysea TaxID=1647581 RepID=A0A9W6B5R0_9FLAO|nr:DUF1569 domain-containing protein [Neptunitalea chrysea]GLB53311.1 hypothetical protein NBRC110019_23520 [Neptunitalea chrysea]